MSVRCARRRRTIDFRRIESAIDVETLQEKRVGVFGLGGAANLVRQLTRLGVERWWLADIDRAERLNLARQDYEAADIGRFKVEALAEKLRAITPDVDVETTTDDFTTIGEDEAVKRLRGVHLIISTTDRFKMQAKANRLALKLGVPAIWPGIYEHALGGEVIFWKPGLPCYRCLVGPTRYAAQHRADAAGETLDPTSDGSTALEGAFVDTIAAMLAVGLLTEGADNRYGRLIKGLGDRNFLRVKISPEFTFHGEDVVRNDLGVPADSDTFFGWNVSALRDPDGGRLFCHDCATCLGRTFPVSAQEGSLDWLPRASSLRDVRPEPSPA